MMMRIPCLVAAALLYHLSPWLAGAIMLLSIPFPWMAVLIANDRMPLKASTFRPFRGDRLPELGIRGRPVADRVDAGALAPVRIIAVGPNHPSRRP
jgi:hypothetical protein